jgi:Tfp pilus assembly protein PilO
MKLNWTTKEGNVINLYDYKDKNHIKNILKILEKQLINKPEIDLEIS